MWPILSGAALLACAGWLGATLNRIVNANVEPFADGPPAFRAPVTLLILGCAIIGGLLAAHNADVPMLILSAIVCSALVACWCSDAELGLVPDAFTLPPLGLVALFAIWNREWWLIASACLAAMPFAAAALFTRGRGLGWGDVKLAALGGAVLGAQLSLLAFAAACGAAVVASRITRSEKGRPIAFAPYLAVAIGMALPLGAFA